MQTVDERASRLTPLFPIALRGSYRQPPDDPRPVPHVFAKREIDRAQEAAREWMGSRRSLAAESLRASYPRAGSACISRSTSPGRLRSVRT